MKLILRCPSPNDEQAFDKAIGATEGSDRRFFHFYEPGMRYRRWLEILEDKRNGRNLEPGLGPSTFLLGLVGTTIVGRLTLRHFMVDEIFRERGHIGYKVIPEFQRKGYATDMLRLSLPIAASVGLNRVFVTCDQGNVASRKTIERCGGIFSGVFTPSDKEVPKLQFWIDPKYQSKPLDSGTLSTPGG